MSELQVKYKQAEEGEKLAFWPSECPEETIQESGRSGE